MAGGQRHHRRLQARAKPGRGDQLRQPGAGPRAAVPAAQLVRAMLGQDHADRWQLGDLVATEPPLGLQLPGRELTATPAARLRVVIDDLIDLILRAQLATGTAMPRLPTRLAPLALPAHQLLGLRPRPPSRGPPPAPPPAAAPASSADPSTAAPNWSASPAAPAPQAASTDPRAAQTSPRDRERTPHTPHAPSHRSPPPRRGPCPQDSLHQQGIPAAGPDD